MENVSTETKVNRARCIPTKSTGKLRHDKRLKRSALRGREKVDGQWKPNCPVRHEAGALRESRIRQAGKVLSPVEITVATVDRENGRKMKNDAGKTGAIFLRKSVGERCVPACVPAKAGMIHFALEQMMHRVLEAVGQERLLQIHRQKSRAGVDRLASAMVPPRFPLRMGALLFQMVHGTMTPWNYFFYSAISHSRRVPHGY